MAVIKYEIKYEYNTMKINQTNKLYRKNFLHISILFNRLFK